MHVRASLLLHMICLSALVPALGFQKLDFSTSKTNQPLRIPASSACAGRHCHRIHAVPPSTTRRYAATSPDETDYANLVASVTPPSGPLQRGVNQQEQKRQRDKQRRKQLKRQRLAETKIEDEERDKQDQFFIMLAVVPSLIAFLSWEDISLSLATFLDQYGAIGRAVDGQMFATNLLRPTITGVVVPVISIALATLVSTTVNVLRARQVELRALVNKESCELRLLRRAVFGMFGTRQHASRRARALALLCGYVEQLERESTEGAVDALEELQLSGGIGVNELDRLSAMLHGVDGAAASRQGSVGVADGLILSLNGHRSDRVALLLSVFPFIHWGVLVALSLSVIATFLLVSNQQILQYLNSVQLRSLFAILVGVCSGTATLCLDLADPFRGSFSIAEASTQLEDLRICLREDVAEATAEAGEINSRLVHSLLLGGSTDAIVENGKVSSKDTLIAEGGDSLQETYRLHHVLKENDYNADKISNALSREDLVSASAKNDWNSPPRRYGPIRTVYFHLLTGPMGSNVRVLGDVIAWVATCVTSQWQSFSRALGSMTSAIRRKSWWPRSRQGKNDTAGGSASK